MCGMGGSGQCRLPPTEVFPLKRALQTNFWRLVIKLFVMLWATTSRENLRDFFLTEILFTHNANQLKPSTLVICW